VAHSKLRDVAARSGVSISTASRALNNRADVSSKTKARVLKVAEELGYVPSSLAKGLWSGQTKTVGVVVTTIANPFYANVVTGIEHVLEEQEYNILLNSSHEDPQRELRAVKLLLEQRVDGIILAPVQTNPKAVDFLEKNGVPYVLVGRTALNVQANHVVCDDYRVGELAARHLVSRGHKEIMFINSAYNYSAQLRQEGFCKTLLAAGITMHPQWIRTVHGGETVGKVLSEALDEGLKPTAIFCFCDQMAIGAMKELRRRGRRIPEDVAIMGVDNLEVTEMLDPPLTTIEVHNNDLGIESAEILLRRIAHNDAIPEQVKLQPKLIERAST